jgi:tetratricopeptide (TPR) repeat protein
MTQADLAGADFTKGFISLLETGRTRVSLRAADILARRLGTSAAELMATSESGTSELEVLLLRAEQQLAAGRAAEAIELVTPVVRQTSGVLKARATRLSGRASVEVGKPKDGLLQLEEAGRAFEVLGYRELALRTLYDRAIAHAHLNEPGAALAAALECELGLRAMGVVDKTLELQLRTLLAATFARAGDLDSADVQAQQALALSADVVDTESLATLYSTMSVSLQRQNDVDGAARYARKSLSLYESLGRERAVGQMWHNLAAIYLQQRDTERAEKAIANAERVAKGAQVPSLDARLLSLRAELAATARRWGQVEALAQAAIDHPSASTITRSRALTLQARALLFQKAPLPKIRGVLDRAIQELHDEPPRVQAETHEAYADMLGQRAEWKGAFEQAQLALRLSRTAFR